MLKPINSKPLKQNSADIRDLSEFCLEWPNLRECLNATAAPTEDWNPDAKNVLNWLIMLADRTCVLGAD